MLIEILTIASAAINISAGCLIIFACFKIKKYLSYIKMNADELLQDVLPEQEPSELGGDKKRERLSAIVAGGGSKQYLGRELQLSDIDAMSSEEINKLYCRYEAKLGACMTKTLDNSIINLYAMGVAKFFSITNPPKLIEDLEEDPFVNHALTTTCCELYYRYGMYLAPLTAMLTTAKHIDFKNKNNTIDINDGTNEQQHNCAG